MRIICGQASNTNSKPVRRNASVFLVLYLFLNSLSANEYFLDSAPKSYLPGDKNETPFVIPADPKICSLYLENLQYFARHGKKKSSGQLIAPGLNSNIQIVAWEDLNPDQYSEIFMRSNVGGEKPSIAAVTRYADRVKSGNFVFRRAELKLNGQPDFVDENGSRKPIAAAFQIIQFGSSDDGDRGLMLVSEDLRRVYSGLADWHGLSGQNLWMLNHRPYVELLRQNGDVQLSEIRTDFPVRLEPICLYHLKRTTKRAH